jgi:hypothetical protein
MSFAPQALSPAVIVPGMSVFPGADTLGPMQAPSATYASDSSTSQSPSQMSTLSASMSGSEPIPIPQNHKVSRSREILSSSRQRQRPHMELPGTCPSTFPQAGYGNGMPPVPLSPMDITVSVGPGAHSFGGALLDNTLYPGPPPDVLLERRRRHIERHTEELKLSSGDED